MRHQLRPLLLFLCLAWLAACSRAEQASLRSPGTLSAAAIAAPTSTPTTLSRYNAEIAAAQAAATRGDFEGAVAVLAPIYSFDRGNAALAELLATYYAGWGRAILSADPGRPGAARDALDALARAAMVAPPATEVAHRASVERAVVQSLLNGWAALAELRRLTEAGSPLAEREPAARQALNESARAADALPEFPGVREVRAASLVEAGRLQLALGQGVQQGANRERYLDQAAAWCDAASQLWPPDAPEGDAARSCLHELARSAAPSPEARPAPAPAAASSPRAGSFRAIPQRTFPPGPQTDERLSCIVGTVVRADGSPIAGAVGNVNNAAAFLHWTTDSVGRYSACGLGWSNWAVVLDYIPDTPGLSRQVAIGGVWLDGTEQQQAIIVFKEQR